MEKTAKKKKKKEDIRCRKGFISNRKGENHQSRRPKRSSLNLTKRLQKEDPKTDSKRPVINARTAVQELCSKFRQESSSVTIEAIEKIAQNLEIASDGFASTQEIDEESENKE